MKKWLKYGVVSLAACILSVCLLTGCMGNYTYDRAKAYTAGNGSVASSGITALSVDWIAGDVTIRAEDTDSVTFTEETNDTDPDYLLRYAVLNGELKIKFQKSGVKTRNGFSKNLTVVVPRVVFRTVDAENVSGDITLIGVSANEIDAESVSGDVYLTDCSAHELISDTVSGDISVQGFERGQIKLDSVSGDISVLFDTADFRIEFETVSGRIKNLCGAAQRGDIYSMGNGAVYGEAETVSGDFTIDVKALEE